MESPATPYRAEVPGNMHVNANVAELQPNYVQGRPHHAQYPQNYPQGHQGYSPPPQRQEMDGMSSNMNSGPVYEMSGQHGWR